MPRATTTSDVFNAIAEPRRRRIVEVLASGERARAVNDLVEILALPQPVVSKHLGVLRTVGVVTVEQVGRQRLYRLNAMELKPVHDWSGTFARFWDNHLDQIKARAERLARERGRTNPKPSKEKPS